MSHSFNKIWIHAVWSTKGRMPLITNKVERILHQHIREQFIEMGCLLRIVNGMPDHIHCLFLLNSQKSISEVIKQVKGSSSHFINEQNLIQEKFAWQNGYAAFSVNESGAEKVFRYIKYQKQHHAKATFEQEFQEFIGSSPGFKPGAGAGRVTN